MENKQPLHKMEGRASEREDASFSFMCVGGCEGWSIWAGVMAELVIKGAFCANILECKCGVMRFSPEKVYLQAPAVGFKRSDRNLFLIWSSLLRACELFLCISQPGGVGALNAFPPGFFLTLMCTKAPVPGVRHPGKQCGSVLIVPLSERGCAGLPPNNLPPTEEPAANSCMLGESGEGQEVTSLTLRCCFSRENVQADLSINHPDWD